MFNDQINLASTPKRAAAFAIDELIVSILFFIIYIDRFQQAVSSEEVMALVSHLVWQLIAIKVLYHTFFTWAYGATIGKFVCKIRCVDFDGQKPDLKASLIRSLIRVVSESIFYIGFIWANFNPLKQTWQDKIAQTLVVNIE